MSRTILIMFSVAIVLLVVLYTVPIPGVHDTFIDQFSGRILLQVEQNGEAWYVDPETKTRHALGSPSDALRLMQSLGTPITDDDLQKIPLSK
jgi:hypothetical protein